jgi:hypothetical protein
MASESARRAVVEEVLQAPTGIAVPEERKRMAQIWNTNAKDASRSQDPMAFPQQRSRVRQVEVFEKVRCVDVTGYTAPERQSIFDTMMHELVLAENGDEFVFREVPSSRRGVRQSTVEPSLRSAGKGREEER